MTSGVILDLFPPNGGRNVQLRFPLPDQIGFDSSYNWESTPMDTLAGTIKTGVENVDSVKSAGRMALGVAGRMAQNTNLFGSGDVAGSLTRLAPNPNLEVMFRGVSNREFSLSWSIGATSAAQMRMYLRYINILYMLSAPDDYLQTHFEYPYTGRLAIEDMDKKIIKDRMIAIKSVNTDLTPDGIFSTFADGTPVHIRLSMSFIETVVPTRRNDSQVFTL